MTKQIQISQRRLDLISRYLKELFIAYKVFLTCVGAGADTGGVDRVDIHPPFFSKKKIRNVTLFEIENKERKKN